MGTLCVFFTSDGDCNEQPTATVDQLNTTDVDCNDANSDSIALTENQVCYSIT